MAVYNVGVSEEQSAQDSVSWAVGEQVVLDMDYNDAMDMPESERFHFDFAPSGLYAVSVVWV